MAIRAKYPDVSIVRTSKQKSKQHTYYAVETKDVRQLIKQIRRGGKV